MTDSQKRPTNGYRNGLISAAAVILAMVCVMAWLWSYIGRVEAVNTARWSTYDRDHREMCVKMAEIQTEMRLIREGLGWVRPTRGDEQ